VSRARPWPGPAGTCGAGQNPVGIRPLAPLRAVNRHVSPGRDRCQALDMAGAWHRPGANYAVRRSRTSAARRRMRGFASLTISSR
jgi:hypothetical protein